MGDRQTAPLGGREQLLHLVARIDQRGVTCILAADQKSILEKRSDGGALDYHVGLTMILAVLDDLMFTSKIKTTAGQLGVDVTFARSADAALAEMRRTPPAIVVLDLNNQRIDPLGIVARMKEDPALASVPTVGYASHVHTDVINAARRAGVDEVLARSAFTQQLPEILKRGQIQ